MRTYQVFITDAKGKTWFEPLLSESDADLLSKLRRRLAEDQLEAIRVEHEGRVLFTLER